MKLALVVCNLCIPLERSELPVLGLLRCRMINHLTHTPKKTVSE